MPRQTHAAFIIDFVQDGSNVDATGGGSFNLAALGNTGGTTASAAVDGANSRVILGSTSDRQIDTYLGYVGPSDFGNDILTPASSGSGPTVGLSEGLLDVPHGYASGTLISDADTFDSTTLADMGLPDGTYTYTWGSGPTADSLVINVGPTSAVPEPVSIGMLGVGGVILLRQRRNHLRG